MKILAFSGSLRHDSWNQKLIKIVAAGARKAGANVDLISLIDFPLPLYNADDEERAGLPENALRLKQKFIDAEAFLIASPEYNSSVTAVLKNTIDWVSRPIEGEPFPLYPFKGKKAAIMSASPGDLGGLRSLYHLREILLNIGVTVLPEMVAVPKADHAFNTSGQLNDSKLLERALALGPALFK